MEEIEAVGHFRFSPEHRDAVLRIIGESNRVVREKDVGTLRYEWLISDSGTEVLVREKYRDSAALLAHAANVASLLAELQSIAQANLAIYGEPSAELLALLRGMQVPVFRHLAAADTQTCGDQ